MIVGIGIDVFYFDQAQSLLAEDCFFLLKPSEKAKLQQSHCPQTLAGILALKEAAFKSLLRQEINFWDLEIRWTDHDKPICEFENYRILLSLSYGKDYALAWALCLNKD